MTTRLSEEQKLINYLKRELRKSRDTIYELVDCLPGHPDFDWAIEMGNKRMERIEKVLE